MSNPHPTPPRPRTGFAMVESMVALVILVIAMFMVLNIMLAIFKHQQTSNAPEAAAHSAAQAQRFYTPTP